MTLRLDPGERLHGLGQADMPIELVADRATYYPRRTIPEPHPDLLAILALTNTLPWIGNRLDVGKPVSPVLSDAVSRQFGIDLGPVDTSVSPRRPGNTVSISFGGGQDSAAVARVLGTDAPLVHMKRRKHEVLPTRPTAYRPDVLAAHCAAFSRFGFQVYVIESDIECLCLPHPTYPTWPAIAGASVLLADVLDLGAIATGTVLGSRYFLGGTRLYRPPHPHRRWEAVFEAAGISLIMPLAGGTEAVTGEIVEKAGWEEAVRSCPVGDHRNPCWRCEKCLRKELTNAARLGRDLNQRLLDELRDDGSPLVSVFAKPPYQEHHMYEYAFARLPALMNTSLKPKIMAIRPERGETEWVERFYPESPDHDMTEPWRSRIRPLLEHHVDFMSDRHVMGFLQWDSEKRPLRTS